MLFFFVLSNFANVVICGTCDVAVLEGSMPQHESTVMHLAGLPISCHQNVVNLDVDEILKISTNQDGSLPRRDVESKRPFYAPLYCTACYDHLKDYNPSGVRKHFPQIQSPIKEALVNYTVSTDWSSKMQTSLNTSIRDL